MDSLVSLEILESCLVHGEPCEPGDQVDVLPHQAAQMVALNRAKYVEDAPAPTPPEVVEHRDPVIRKRGK